MNAVTSSTLDPVAARRWAERAPATAPWLHEEVARRMAERLPLIRLPVQQWADWAPQRGGVQGHALVAAQYPKSTSFRVAAQYRKAQPAIETVAKKWWSSWLRSSDARLQTVPAPPDGGVQLVWANMLAHQVAAPAELLGAWHRALAVDGFVMFSCLGPDTLKELRALYGELGWAPPAHEFTDMHDWGDRLVTAGFAEPVMDMEQLTLTYDSPERLLAELRELGRNLHVARFAGLRTPGWRQRLLERLNARLRPSANEPLTLSFEIVYGHAIKSAPRHALKGETRIALGDMRASLRQRP